LLDLAEDESDEEEKDLSEIDRLKSRLAKAGLDKAMDKGESQLA
jgi:hypothetical protein